MRHLIFIAMTLTACATSKPEAAEKAAREYAEHFDDANGIECAQRDTDSDGYCACTVFRRDHDPVRIDCGCERFCVWNCARGCKLVEGLKVQGGRGR